MNFFQKAVSKIFLHAETETPTTAKHFRIPSSALKRELNYDVYLPKGYNPDAEAAFPLVLFNDGQDLPRMNFIQILDNLAEDSSVRPFIAVGIHCNERRQREYGTASQADYKGRGDLATPYTHFILEEFLPHLRTQFAVTDQAKDTAFAGFSLGGLSALDIAWANPEVFGVSGVFSGSLWWRSLDVRPENPDADRIMHEIVRKSSKWGQNQRFWFQCGTLDEEEDRNQNGIIDSIDDTLDLMRVLAEKGIPQPNIRYLEIENGTHEPVTWGMAMGDFLGWAFEKK